MRRVTLLEVFDDAQRMKIVVEAQTVTLQAAIERSLAGVTEGRMPDIVNQGEGFGKVLVQVEGTGDRTGDLGDLPSCASGASESDRWRAR